jgi:hypothetical protein
MYILTQTERIENSKDIDFLVHAPELEKYYLKAGYKRTERFYKITTMNRVFTVICPEFRDGSNGSMPIVIIPDFLVPGRPYPVYVYLFAIDLYCQNSQMGQRAAAKATKEHFGLATFAHTTLGRAMKSFVSTNLKSGGDTEKKEPASQAKFPTAGPAMGLRDRALHLMYNNQKPLPPGCVDGYLALARYIFKKYRRLLM